MREVEKLSAVLTKVESDYQINRIHFHLLESILLNPALRAVLKDDVQQERIAKIYVKSFKGMLNQLIEISRYLFAAIGKEELPYIALDACDPDKRPNYNRLMRYLSNLSLRVQKDILNCDTVELGIFALQRWIEMIIQLIAHRDFNSAAAIYAAINSASMEKYKKNSIVAANLSSRSIDNLKQLDRIFEEGLKIHTVRELMIGEAIPDFSVLTSILSLKKTVLQGEHWESDELIQAVFKSIVDMQKKSVTLIDPNNLQDLKRVCANQRVPRETLIVNLLQLDNMLNTATATSAAAQPLGQEPDWQALAAAMEESELDGLLFDIATRRCASSKISSDFTSANEYWVKFFNFKKDLPVAIPATLIQYEGAINKLREYALSKTNDENGNYRRAAMSKLLHDLGLLSDLRKKINFIKEAIAINKEIKKQKPKGWEKITLNSEAISCLNTITYALEAIESSELTKNAELKALERIKELNQQGQKMKKDINSVSFQANFIQLSMEYDSLPQEAALPLLPDTVSNRSIVTERDTSNSKLFVTPLKLDDSVRSTTSAGSPLIPKFSEPHLERTSTDTRFPSEGKNSLKSNNSPPNSPGTLSRVTARQSLRGASISSPKRPIRTPVPGIFSSLPSSPVAANSPLSSPTSLDATGLFSSNGSISLTGSRNSSEHCTPLSSPGGSDSSLSSPTSQVKERRSPLDFLHSPLSSPASRVGSPRADDQDDLSSIASPIQTPSASIDDLLNQAPTSLTTSSIDDFSLSDSRSRSMFLFGRASRNLNELMSPNPGNSSDCDLPCSNPGSSQ